MKVGQAKRVYQDFLVDLDKPSLNLEDLYFLRSIWDDFIETLFRQEKKWDSKTKRWVQVWEYQSGSWVWVSPKPKGGWEEEPVIFTKEERPFIEKLVRDAPSVWSRMFDHLAIILDGLLKEWETSKFSLQDVCSKVDEIGTLTFCLGFLSHPLRGSLLEFPSEVASAIQKLKSLSGDSWYKAFTLGLSPSESIYLALGIEKDSTSCYTTHPFGVEGKTLLAFASRSGKDQSKTIEGLRSRFLTIAEALSSFLKTTGILPKALEIERSYKVSVAKQVLSSIDPIPSYVKETDLYIQVKPILKIIHILENV